MSTVRRFQIQKTWCGKVVAPAAFTEVRAEFVGHDLKVFIDAPFHGDPPPSQQPGPTDRLWEYEVVELFLVGEDGQYLELEFGPFGHYLMLWLSAPRVLEARSLACTYRVISRDGRWRAQAIIPREALPMRIERVNAFAIFGPPDARTYLAWHPLPGSKPDFHQPQTFRMW